MSIDVDHIDIDSQKEGWPSTSQAHDGLQKEVCLKNSDVDRIRNANQEEKACDEKASGDEVTSTPSISRDNEEPLKSTLLSIALDHPPSHWKDVSEKDDQGNVISSHYQFFSSSCYRMRSCMKFAHGNSSNDIIDYYNYLESGYNDDDLTWSNKTSLNIIVKILDSDTQIMYNKGDGGLLNKIIKPRDSCYVRTRFMYKNYKYNEINYDISGSLHYNVHEKDAYFYPLQKDCIRADMKYRGFVMIRNNELNEIKIVYIAFWDIKGRIPQWVSEPSIKKIGINYIKRFHDTWKHKIKQLKERNTINDKNKMKIWFDKIVKLPQYYDIFFQNGFEDLSYLRDIKLTEKDLIDMDITLKGHRCKIFHEIEKL